MSHSGTKKATFLVQNFLLSIFYLWIMMMSIISTSNDDKRMRIQFSHAQTTKTKTPTNFMMMAKNFSKTVFSPTLPILSTVTQAERNRTHSLSPSLSISDSGPIKPGSLRWLFPNGQLAPQSYIPSFFDIELRSRNFSFEGVILHDELITEGISNPYEMLNLSLPLATITQTRGILERMKRGFVISEKQPGSFGYNATHFQFTFVKDDFFQIKVDEDLFIQFYANFTATHLIPWNHLQIRILAEQFPADDVLVGLITTSTVISALSLLLYGVPGTHEVQAIVMMGSMNCIDKTAATFSTGTEPLLAPTPLTADSHGRFSGNIITFFYVTICHYLLLGVLKQNIKKIGMDELKYRTSSPSIPFAVLILLFPGFIYYSFRSFYDIIGGGLTVLLFILFLGALGGIFWVVKYITKQPAFVRRKYVKSGGNDAGCGMLCSVHGQWQPWEFSKAYRSIIGELTSSSADGFIMYIPFICSTLTAAGTAIEPATATQCKGQFALLSLYFLIVGVFFLWKRPYRFFFQNVSSALNMFSLIILTGASVANNSYTPRVYQGGLLTIFVLTVLRGLVTMVAVCREVKDSLKSDFMSGSSRRPLGASGFGVSFDPNVHEDLTSMSNTPASLSASASSASLQQQQMAVSDAHERIQSQIENPTGFGDQVFSDSDEDEEQRF